jgi:hypothetical protein
MGRAATELKVIRVMELRSAADHCRMIFLVQILFPERIFTR